MIDLCLFNPIIFFTVAMLPVILMYAIWSSAFPLGKFILTKSSPLFSTGCRMVIGGAILLAWLLIKRKSLKIDRQLLWPLFLLSIFSIYLTNTLEYWALQYLSSAKACFIYGLSPLFTALLSHFYFGERVNTRKICGLLLSFIGFIPIFIHKTEGERDLQALYAFSWPEFAMIGAVLCSIYGWILLRDMLKRHETSPFHANGYSMVFGGVIALLHSLLIDSWHPIPIANGQAPSFIYATIAMTLLSNIICYNFYGYMLKKFTATFLSLMGLLSPLFVSFSGAILLGEPFSREIIFSTPIVVIGLFIVYRTELQQGYVSR